MNKVRFAEAVSAVNGTEEKEGIGTLSEKPLHRIFKYYLEPDSSRHEVKLSGVVADVYNQEGIFEIQTGGFYPLKKKLLRLLPEHKVTVVRPVISEKNIIWIDKDSGEMTEPKKSPKKGRFSDILPELTRLGEVFPCDGLTVKLVLISADEYKYLDGYGESKKRRATKVMILPRSLVCELDLRTKEDVAGLIPDLPSPFRAKDLEAALRLRGKRNFFVLKYLLSLGIIERVGKDGNAFLYEKKMGF